MKNKGFTLIEIIAVIAILGLLLVLLIPNISKTGDASKDQAYNFKIEEIERAAVMYAQDHKNDIKKNNTASAGTITTEITVNDLINVGLLEPDDNSSHIINPKDTSSYLNDCNVKITIAVNKNDKITAEYVGC